HGERARVENAAGDLAQRPQLLALAPDAVGEHAAQGRGMRPAGLAEAAHEHVLARLEVEHLERDAARAQLLEDARALVEEVPRAARALSRSASTCGGGSPASAGVPAHSDSPARRRWRLAISASMRSAKSSALCRPCARRRWLRAAVSISIAMLRPGRTGTRTKGSSTSSSG